MVSPGRQYGSWALVAGAAEGLGEGFTRALAAAGFNLVLVDRNLEAMIRLADALRQSFGVETRCLHVDLGAADAASQCLSMVRECDCRIMVYVAAWSRVACFTDLESADLDGFISVNTRTPLTLVHGFTKHLKESEKPGGVILVASLAGLIGPKFVAPYAATKAFSIRLAEALHGELKPIGIEILACCAGTVSTPTYWKSRPDFRRMKPPVMEPLQVADQTLRQLGKKVVFIPGFKNRLQYLLLLNLLPRRIARWLVNDAMEKMYGAVNR